MAGLLDLLTGGDSSGATDAEKNAIAALQGVQTPTEAQLTLPELQQEVNAGQMTPAQMQAYLQQTNALSNEDVSQTGTSAQTAALNQLANVANAGAAGTPVEQAQIAQAEQASNRNLAGQRGAIEQSAEARGVPGSLLSAALESQNAGIDAQNQNQADLQAQSQAYQTALNAMSQGAGVGQALQGQQNTQANTVAQAQNAMQQFNAANQQAASAANQNTQQQANAYNTQNAQNISNTNTGLKNQQTEYNAQLPETVFNNQMQKAGGIAGQNNQMANTLTQQGQQQAGLAGGLLGTAGTVIGGMYGGPMGAAAGNALGSQIGGANGPPASANTQQYAPQGQYQPLNYAEGGMVPCMDDGGTVPGQAPFPGDSLLNDVQPIMASPGEAVIPRSAVQQNPSQVMSLLSGGSNEPPVSPQDVATLLQAMKMLRTGGQNAIA